MWVVYIFILSLVSTGFAHESSLIIDDIEYKCGSTNTADDLKSSALDNIYVCLVFDDFRG